MSARRWFRRRGVLIAAVIVSLAVVAIVVGIWSRTTARVAQVPFSDLVQGIDRGLIATIAVSDDTLVFQWKNGDVRQTTAPHDYMTNPALVSDLARKNIRIDVRPADSQNVLNRTAAGLLVLLAGLVGLTLYRSRGGRIPVLGGGARLADPRTVTVTFADVAGVDEAKEEVQEIVDFLQHPGRFAAIGGRIPKGVLLVGPPGTGKTLLARSIAGEAKVPFLFACGSDFVEMFAGVGAARIRRLFRDARKHRSCIVFIDELDAVGRSRGSQSFSHEEREQTLNQLLVEMDGFATHQGVVVIAATNRPDILDPALLRPGRFDRQVTVDAPDLKGREEILRIHGRNVALDPDVDLRQVARGTPGFSGAELANLMNEAALLAVRSGRTVVNAEDVDRARDKVLMGAERKSLQLSEPERVTCAYHESGHAVVAALLPHADPLHKVTIVPRGRALGVTMQLPEGDRHTHTRAFLESQIALLMGGRVAEEIFLSQMTSGAGNDIDRATEIARRMVCEFGMSSLGPLAFRTGRSWESDRGAGISEAMAWRVDEQVHELVMRGYDTARQLIGQHPREVRALAEQLLEVESLDAADVKGIMAAASSSS